MKRCLMTLGILFISISAFSQELNRTFQYDGRPPILLGQSTPERLKEEPFADWFTASYDEYEVSKEAKDLSMSDSITIFMGSWCSDSQREVPRFMKILEQTDFDISRLKIICLNTGFQNYKQAPEREEKGVDIHRVPTFIFQNADGSEIGRIVEEPVVSLEEDMRKVLKGEDYKTYYPVAQDLIKRFKNNSLSELKKQMNQLVSAYKEMSVSEYELNTYGYVLWTSFQIEKAEFVFELNYRLYPEAIGAISSISRYKSTIGKQKEAKKYLAKGLALEPDNKWLLDIKKNFELLK